MPTYEYICEACQHEFEQFQSIKADPVKICPECGKEHVRRKISAGAGILFKGGGFYETDYRSAGYKESAKKDSEAGGKNEGKSESKSEGKSESSKSESKADAAPPKSESKPVADAPKPAAKAESKPAAKKE